MAARLSNTSSLTKTLKTYLPKPLTVKRSYNQGKKDNSSGHGIDEERARSTAEEFERVAEEKSRQGFTSHTVEKAQDAAGEAISNDSEFEDVKEAYKEPPGKGDFHKTGDDS